MTTINGALLRDPTGAFIPSLGYRVLKTENINTPTGVDLFTVTGKIHLTLWTVEVTNALGALVLDYKIRIKTDNVDLCAATNLGGAVVGWHGGLDNIPGSDMIQGIGITLPRFTDLDAGHRVLGNAGGSLTLESLRTAGDSGDELKHTVYYWPMEAGAVMVPA